MNIGRGKRGRVAEELQVQIYLTLTTVDRIKPERTRKCGTPATLYCHPETRKRRIRRDISDRGRLSPIKEE